MQTIYRRNLAVVFFLTFFSISFSTLFGPSICPAGEWQSLGKGLDLAGFEAPLKSTQGDSRVTVLRINPKFQELKLLTASQHGKKTRTAGQWCREFGLSAAINASMYQTDHLTSTGLMKNFKHWNNKRLNPKDYNAVLAFNPVSPGSKPAVMIDLRCDDYKSLMKRYRSLIQNIRLLNCQTGNAWSKKDQFWSTAAVGLDKSGRVLFIHCRSPYRVHDFINILLSLPLDLARGMYVEGGPEASLSIRAGEMKNDLCGSFETGFNENNDNKQQWPIPNVIGVVKKK